MTGKGLTWTTAHLRAASTPQEVRIAITEASLAIGESQIPAATVLAHLEELAVDAAAARAELRNSTRIREVLLASIAHDLRNPLNTFAMSAGLLRDDLESPDLDRARALSLVARMDRASARMQALIEDLLEASRLEAGAVELTKRVEPAAMIVRDAIAKAKPTVAERGAALDEGDISADAKINADRHRAVEGLVKLVAVALKTTGEGGTIRLGAERIDGRVALTMKASPPRGSSAAPSAAHDEGRGGLALTIARNIFTLHGAELGVELTPDGPRTVVSFDEAT